MGRQVGGSRRHLGRARLVRPFQRVLVDRATRQYGHNHGHLRGQAHHLDRADAGRVGDLAHDDRRVVGEVGKEPAGVGQELLQLPVGSGEERSDLLRLSRSQTSGFGDGVHEEAVALVGRDASHAGVGLNQVALPLEHAHLVAHRGRGHRKLREARHRTGSDRLGGLDVFLHYRFEDGGFAIVEHVGTQRYRVPVRSRWQTG